MREHFVERQRTVGRTSIETRPRPPRISQPERRRGTGSFQLILDARESGTPVMEINPARISRVLMNVLTNTIKYTPEGGRIEVVVERQANEARISIKDSGTGHRGRPARDSVRGIQPHRHACSRVWSRALHRARDRERARRANLGREQARTRLDVPHLFSRRVTNSCPGCRTHSRTIR